MVLARGDYLSRLFRQLRIDREFRLALHQIAAWRNKPGYRPDIGLDLLHFCFGHTGLKIADRDRGRTFQLAVGSSSSRAGRKAPLLLKEGWQPLRLTGWSISR